MATARGVRLRLGSAAGACLLLAAAAAGCAREETNRRVVFGPDSIIAPMALGLPDFPAPPRGVSVANRLELVSFDVNVLDAFGRATQPFRRDQYPYFGFFGGAWLWGGDADIFGGVAGRRWGTADDDPRKPTLVQRAADLEFDFMFIAPPGVFADDYDIYGEWCCAPPGQKFVVGFERAALEVRGELDAAQVLLGEPVDAPDSLFPLPFNPGGDPVRPANKFQTDDPYPAVAGANPYLFGTVMSCPTAPPYDPYDVANLCLLAGLPDGYVIIDVVVSARDAAGNTVLMPDATPNQALSPVAPNFFTRHSLPNYNYLTMWFANPDGTPDYSRPLVRYQLGVDLSPFGGPVNNAFAPFPDGPLSEARLALGLGAESQPDSVTATFTNLKALAGGAVYQAWFVGGSSGPVPAEGRYIHLAPDGDTLQDMTTSSFVGGEGSHILIVDYPPAAEGRTHVVLTIESAAGAGSPSARQPLWLAALQEPGAPKSTSQEFRFGTFANGGPGQRVWSVSGLGEGSFFGNELRVRFQHLPRPPVGYQYVGWLASDTTLVRLPDESFTSPPREYAPLTNADVDASVSAVVLPLEILEAVQRFCTVELTGCAGPFDLAPHARYVLTLEPKASDPNAKGPVEVLIGSLPKR